MSRLQEKEHIVIEVRMDEKDLISTNARQSMRESDWFVFPWKCWFFHLLYGRIRITGRDGSEVGEWRT